MNDPLSAEIRQLTKYQRLALGWGACRGLIKNILLSAMTAAVTSEEMAKQFKLVEEDSLLSPYFIAALTIGASYEILLLFAAKKIEENDLLDEKREKTISSTKMIAVARDKPGEAFMAVWMGSVQKQPDLSEEELEENIRISCCTRANLMMGAILGMIRGCILAAAPTAIATREFFTKAAPQPFLQHHLISMVYFFALIYGVSDEIEKIIAGKRITTKDIRLRKNLISSILSIFALGSRHPRSGIQLACCCYISIEPAEALELERREGKQGTEQKSDDGSEGDESDHDESDGNRNFRAPTEATTEQNSDVPAGLGRMKQPFMSNEANYTGLKNQPPEKDVAVAVFSFKKKHQVTTILQTLPTEIIKSREEGALKKKNIPKNLFLNFSVFSPGAVEKPRNSISKSVASGAQFSSKIGNANKLFLQKKFKAMNEKPLLKPTTRTPVYRLASHFSVSHLFMSLGFWKTGNALNNIGQEKSQKSWKEKAEILQGAALEC